MRLGSSSWPRLSGVNRVTSCTFQSTMGSTGSNHHGGHPIPRPSSVLTMVVAPGAIYVVAPGDSTTRLEPGNKWAPAVLDVPITRCTSTRRSTWGLVIGHPCDNFPGTVGRNFPGCTRWLHYPQASTISRRTAPAWQRITTHRATMMRTRKPSPSKPFRLTVAVNPNQLRSMSRTPTRLRALTFPVRIFPAKNS